MLAFVGVEAIVSVVSRERRSDSGSNGGFCIIMLVGALVDFQPMRVVRLY